MKTPILHSYVLAACSFVFVHLGDCISEAQPPASLENDNVPRVWIYRNQPEEGQPETRGLSEKYFTPFFFFPESKTSKIVVDPQHKLPKEDGTCIEMFFELKGGDDFAGAGLIPGDRLGDKPPLNILKFQQSVDDRDQPGEKRPSKISDAGLDIGFDRPVFLKFRARTGDGQSVNVRFESCGLAVGKVRDGIRPAQTPSPDVTPLTGTWKEIRIDLTKKAMGLEKVASPLRVVVRASDNPDKREITVLVDDIRFEVGRPGK